jgi:hypothetical protein
MCVVCKLDEEEMKVLFLDVDGVLNSQESMGRLHHEWLASGEKTKTGKYCFPLGHLDETLIGRLNDLVELTDCHIVLSSTWRKVTELHEFRGYMVARGFKYSERIVSKTPVLNLTGEQSCRGREIQLWIDEHKEQVSTYAILDDDSFDIIKIHPNNLVHVYFMEGLRECDITKVSKILNPKSALSFT